MGTRNNNPCPCAGQGGGALHYRPDGEHATRPGQARLSKDWKLATHKELSDFLAGVERRAFKHALYAVRDEDAALDIVQEAMLKLAERYADRPPGELPMLFQRILQNATNDHFRRSKVRNTWTRLFSSFFTKDDDEEHDVLEMLESQQAERPLENPENQVGQMQTLAEIEAALQKLPARQREAFLLRYWEELDVAETAAAMGCSEGSVKTHCSRAVHALAEVLSARGVKL